MPDGSESISAEDAARILRRASELDVRGMGMTLDELRRVSVEAGIDPRATERAIEEVRHSPVDDTSRSTPPPFDTERALRGMVLGGAVGLILGVLAGWWTGLEMEFLAAILVFALLRLVEGRFKEDRVSFLFQNFVLWFTFWIGAGLPLPGLIWPAAGWTVSSMVGLALPRGQEAGDALMVEGRVPSTSPEIPPPSV